MSIPTFVGIGAKADSTGAPAPEWPAGHQADDIGLMFVQTNAQNVAAPSGWTEVTNSPQSTGTAGALGATRLHVFWKRWGGRRYRGGRDRGRRFGFRLLARTADEDEKSEDQDQDSFTHSVTPIPL